MYIYIYGKKKDEKKTPAQAALAECVGRCKASGLLAAASAKFHIESRSIMSGVKSEKFGTTVLPTLTVVVSSWVSTSLSSQIAVSSSENPKCS